MSQSKELSSVVSDIRAAGESIIKSADALEKMFSGSKETSDTVLKLTDVRKVLAEKARVSKANTDAVRELLKKHGADKLSEIDPQEYESLLADAEVLPDA